MHVDDTRETRETDGSEHDEAELKDRGSLGGAPDMPDSGSGVLERCREEREDLTPKETAMCAGLRTAELSENEEDGGS